MQGACLLHSTCAPALSRLACHVHSHLRDGYNPGLSHFEAHSLPHPDNLVFCFARRCLGDLLTVCIRQRPGGTGQALVEELGEEVHLVFRKRRMGGGRAEENRASPIDRNSHLSPGDLGSEAWPTWKPPKPVRHAPARLHAFGLPR